MRYYLACYDICDPARLRLGLNVLLDFAHSRQYSVFECQLSAMRRDELVHRMALVTEDEDRFLLIPILHNGPVHHLGVARFQLDDAFLFLG